MVLSFGMHGSALSVAAVGCSEYMEMLTYVLCVEKAGLGSLTVNITVPN